MQIFFVLLLSLKIGWNLSFFFMCCLFWNNFRSTGKLKCSKKSCCVLFTWTPWVCTSYTTVAHVSTLGDEPRHTSVSTLQTLRGSHRLSRCVFLCPRAIRDPPLRVAAGLLSLQSLLAFSGLDGFEDCRSVSGCLMSSSCLDLRCRFLGRTHVLVSWYQGCVRAAWLLPGSACWRCTSPFCDVTSFPFHSLFLAVSH